MNKKYPFFRYRYSNWLDLVIISDLFVFYDSRPRLSHEPRLAEVVQNRMKMKLIFGLTLLSLGSEVRPQKLGEIMRKKNSLEEVIF